MNEILETFFISFHSVSHTMYQFANSSISSLSGFFAIFFANILSYFGLSAFKGIYNRANSTKAQLRGAVWYRSAFLCMNNKFLFSGKTPV